ncbi:MAG: methyltransferase domain-containing protein [Thiohalocapsa sp.]|jgi:SAM-dependent methyltransferase
MKPCDRREGDPLDVLARWYRTPVGRHVAEAENACAERLLQDSFGHFLVQVGVPAQFRGAAASCRVRHRLVLGEVLNGADRGATAGYQGIRALPYRLPLAPASVDAVLLPHTLDFCADPHQVLREVERVLIPEGRVVLFFFNPLSPWGMMRWWPRRRRVPWCGGQLTPFRVGDWLRLLGLELESRDLLVFRPPLQRAFLPRLQWLDRAGERFWPVFGGVFAVRAVKRVRALTPLRPSWKHPPPLVPGSAVKPTASVIKPAARTKGGVSDTV